MHFGDHVRREERQVPGQDNFTRNRWGTNSPTFVISSPRRNNLLVTGVVTAVVGVALVALGILSIIFQNPVEGITSIISGGICILAGIAAIVVDIATRTL